MRIWSLIFLVAAILGTSGCENELPRNTVRQALELKELPEKVRGAAEKALPGVTMNDAWKNVDQKTRALHSYEIRGRAENGKVREVRVAESGEILEME